MDAHDHGLAADLEAVMKMDSACRRSMSWQLSRISDATDNVLSDGHSLQLGTVSGNATDGYAATPTVAIAA